MTSTVTTVSFDPPWDLHDITPRIFPVPPAAVFGTRTSGVVGPMHGKATHWSGTQPSGVEIDDGLTLEDVPLVQMPTSKEEWSTYKDRFYQGATIVPRSLALVERRDAGPLGTATGSVSIQAERSNLEKKPWKELATLTGIVEERFIFGLHVGPTVFPFRAAEPKLAVLPWTGERVLGSHDADLDRWPGLASWWQRANERWDENRTAKNKLTLAERFDYHSGLTTQGEALGDIRVVYSASGQYLAAAVVDDPRAFIEHKLYWCRARNLEEARYLTAVLNAPVLNQRIAPLQARGEHNPRDIDKYVWALPIPRYDAGDDTHQHLVELAEDGERVAGGVELTGSRFEVLRRHVREALVDAGVAEALDEAVDSLLLRAST